jgi:voltage-gated potassium channel Kch
MPEAFVVGAASGAAEAATAQALKKAGLAAERLEAVYWAGKEIPQAGAAVVRFRGGRLAAQHALHGAAQAILAGDLDVAVAGSAALPAKTVDSSARQALAAELAGRGIVVDARKAGGDDDRPASQAAALALASPAAVGRYNLAPSGSIAARALGYAPAETWWLAGKPAFGKILRQAGIQAAEISLIAFDEPCPGAGMALLAALELQIAVVKVPAGCGAVAQLIALLEKSQARYGVWISLSSAGQACAALIERV